MLGITKDYRVCARYKRGFWKSYDRSLQLQRVTAKSLEKPFSPLQIILILSRWLYLVLPSIGSFYEHILQNLTSNPLSVVKWNFQQPFRQTSTTSVSFLFCIICIVIENAIYYVVKKNLFTYIQVYMYTAFLDKFITIYKDNFSIVWWSFLLSCSPHGKTILKCFMIRLNDFHRNKHYLWRYWWSNLKIWCFSDQIFLAICHYLK